MQRYRAGIDIGSTTVKLVLLDASGQILFGKYRRHQAHTQETLAELLSEARETVGECMLRIRITGSGSINLGKALGIEFVQEVVAVATALQQTAPQTDVAIELGGEDAKIIYFTGGLEERMNGVCAGGTGSFIDQMAALLQTDAAGLNREAEHYQQIYPIAARCGVFAKTDIQPLINEGATRADLAASIFQAVVNQTISGLACGKPIRGCVAFLGGPLHFLPELKKAFIRTLGLTAETTVDPENSHLFAAMGAALESGESDDVSIDTLISRLEQGVAVSFEMPRLPALFPDRAAYDAFCARHARATVAKGDLAAYRGECFLGIDAGSTTTKLALVGERGELLYSFYTGNSGNPIEAAKRGIRALRDALPAGAKIVRSCSTGYGEALLKSAFSLDEGEVETIAHCTAAAFFDPAVDCVLDIGGQDMKCIRLKGGAVDSIMLNEACSSGCGSFIENFANSLGYTAQDFAQTALFAGHPVDLGTRCTVFMNSNVKQAQKEGASVADISAGLAYSVIKNALYKVIKLSSAEELGHHIVVQGGTFHNQAVLRAFEKIAGADVTCPDISGVMGAFGAALLARRHYRGQETAMLPLDEILNLTYSAKTARCGGCENHCMLTVNTFAGGRRHITGNRCEKPLGATGKTHPAPNMPAYKRQRLFAYPPLEEDAAPRGVLGIPRALNLYENYPYWATFFRELGFRVVLSPLSDRRIYELGMESIPSESECYPAKLTHGHVQWLVNQGIRTIFHPCVFYEHQETPGAQNHFNCPIVVSYPENIRNNVEAVADGDVRYIRPFIAFTSEKTAADRLVRLCRDEWQIPEREVRAAARAAWDEQQRAKADIRAEGARLLAQMEQSGGRGVVLAGRPYHVDPEINHGIPELIASFGLTVFTEDSLPIDFTPTRPLRVVRPVGLPLEALLRGGVCRAAEGSGAHSAQLLRLRARRRHDRSGRRAARGRGQALYPAENRRGGEPRRGAHPHPEPPLRDGHARGEARPRHGARHRAVPPCGVYPRHAARGLYDPRAADEPHPLRRARAGVPAARIPHGRARQRQPQRRRHGAQVRQQRRLLSLHYRRRTDHGRRSLREVRHGSARHHHDADRRLLPREQLRRLHPPRPREGGICPHPGHLAQCQRDGEERGLPPAAEAAARRGAGARVRRPLHAMPLPCAAV